MAVLLKATPTPPTAVFLTFRPPFNAIPTGRIPESTAPGTVVADISATSQDWLPAPTFGEQSDPDNKWTVSGSTLILSAALNYSVKTSHNIVISATNGVGAPVPFPFTIAVEQTAASAVTVTFRSGFAGGVVPESTAVSTVIADLSGGTGTFTETSDPDNKFTVSGTTLVLSAALNAAVDVSHPVTISSGAASATATITVVAVGAPTGIELLYRPYYSGGPNGGIPTDAGSNAILADIIALGCDRSETTLVFYLLSDPSGRFRIQSTTGSDVLPYGGPIIYKTGSAFANPGDIGLHPITVRAENSAGYVDVNFNVNVVGPYTVGCPPTPELTWRAPFNREEYGFVPENTPVDTVLGDLTQFGSFPTSATTNPVTYSISPDYNGGGKFTVVGTELRLAAALDYETAAMHKIRVRANNTIGFHELEQEVEVGNVSEVSLVVPNQTLSFGQWTFPSGVTASAPPNSGLVPVVPSAGNITSAVILSGNTDALWDITPMGEIIRSGAATPGGGCTAAALVCQFNGSVTATITIAILTDEYSVSDQKGFGAAMAVVVGTMSGKTIRLRRGVYRSLSGLTKDYTSEVLITKDAGTRPTIVKLTLNGCSHVTLSGFDFHRRQGVANITPAGAGQDMLIYGTGGHDFTRITDNVFRAPQFNPYFDWRAYTGGAHSKWPYVPNNMRGILSSGSNMEVDHNVFQQLGANVVQINHGGVGAHFNFHHNYLTEAGGDGINYGLASNFARHTFEYNIFQNISFSGRVGTHGDHIQGNLSSQTQNPPQFIWRGNILLDDNRFAPLAANGRGGAGMWTSNSVNGYFYIDPIMEDNFCLNWADDSMTISASRNATMQRNTSITGNRIVTGTRQAKLLSIGGSDAGDIETPLLFRDNVTERWGSTYSETYANLDASNIKLLPAAGVPTTSNDQYEAHFNGPCTNPTGLQDALDKYKPNPLGPLAVAGGAARQIGYPGPWTISPEMQAVIALKPYPTTTYDDET